MAGAPVHALHRSAKAGRAHILLRSLAMLTKRRSTWERELAMGLLQRECASGGDLSLLPLRWMCMGGCYRSNNCLTSPTSRWNFQQFSRCGYQRFVGLRSVGSQIPIRTTLGTVKECLVPAGVSERAFDAVISQMVRLSNLAPNTLRRMAR